jgi:transcriptional regulator with XRE-family HTH domain
MSDRPYVLNGSRIRDIREGCGMSLADLAEAMGIARAAGNALGAIEVGRRLPTQEYARRIADALGVFLDDICRHGSHVEPWRVRTGGFKGAVPPKAQPAPLSQRLAEKTEISEDGCWIWRGRINQAGYGEIKVPGGRRLKAHRATYEHHVGPIPDGLDLDHLCRVRPCVNPAHMEPVTRRENIQRSYEARGFARRDAA